MIYSSYKQEVNSEYYSTHLDFIPKYLGRGPVDTSAIRVDAVDHERTTPPDVVNGVICDRLIASGLNL